MIRSGPGNPQTRRRMAVPADPSEDELAQHWNLTPADLVGDRRSAAARTIIAVFALQLCMLRVHGYFLDDYRHAPIKIVNHFSRQLGLPPVLFLDRSGREPDGTGAVSAHPSSSRYPGLRSSRLRPICATGCARVPSRAGPPTNSWHAPRTGCARWRVMLPASSTLERMVISLR